MTIFVIATVGGYLAKVLLIKHLKHTVKDTQTELDDLLVAAVERYLFLWFLLGGLSAAVQTTPLSASYQLLIRRIIVAGLVVSVSLAVSQFMCGMVRLYSGRFTSSATAAKLAENLMRLTILGMGLMLLLTNLGISITPVLTALGVGSLAVALALQDTLSNLFAGIHIIAGDLVEVGDYIKLDTGHEGYVVDVGWRATRIRELANNIISLPNAKLSQAVVVNHHQPDKELAVLVQVGVSYDSDLDLVEKVTIDVARRVMREVPGGIPAFEPFIRYHTFGDSSIDFTVILRAKEFSDRYLLTHEFIKSLHKEYKEKEIDIPFPQRVVRLQGQTPPGMRR